MARGLPVEERERLVLFVGDDWAEDHHDIEIVDETGRRLVHQRLPEGAAGIASLHALIADRTCQMSCVQDR